MKWSPGFKQMKQIYKYHDYIVSDFKN